MKSNKKNKVKFGSLKSPLKIKGLPSIYCFICDKNKRVIEINSLQKALGYEGKSEHWLLNFLITMSKFIEIPEKILQAYNHPEIIEINPQKSDASNLSVINHQICQTSLELIVKAKNEGLLQASQMKYAKNAAEILNQTKAIGLKKIINEATGFYHLKNRNKLLIQQFLLKREANTSFLWIEHLPNRFFKKLLKLENLTWSNLEHQPDKLVDKLFDVFLVHIPEELGQQIESQKPKRIYRRKYENSKNQIFPELEAYLNNIILLIDQSAADVFIFNQLFKRAYPAKTVVKKPNTRNNDPTRLSSFNEVLKKIIQ